MTEEVNDEKNGETKSTGSGETTETDNSMHPGTSSNSEESIQDDITEQNLELDDIIVIGEMETPHPSARALDHEKRNPNMYQWIKEDAKLNDKDSWYARRRGVYVPKQVQVMRFMGRCAISFITFWVWLCECIMDITVATVGIFFLKTHKYMDIVDKDFDVAPLVDPDIDVGDDLGFVTEFFKLFSNTNQEAKKGKDFDSKKKEVVNRVWVDLSEIQFEHFLVNWILPYHRKKSYIRGERKLRQYYALQISLQFIVTLVGLIYPLFQFFQCIYMYFEWDIEIYLFLTLPVVIYWYSNLNAFYYLWATRHLGTQRQWHMIDEYLNKLVSLRAVWIYGFVVVYGLSIMKWAMGAVPDLHPMNSPGGVTWELDHTRQRYYVRNFEGRNPYFQMAEIGRNECNMVMKLNESNRCHLDPDGKYYQYKNRFPERDFPHNTMGYTLLGPIDEVDFLTDRHDWGWRKKGLLDTEHTTPGFLWLKPKGFWSKLLHYRLFHRREPRGWAENQKSIFNDKLINPYGMPSNDGTLKELSEFGDYASNYRVDGAGPNYYGHLLYGDASTPFEARSSIRIALLHIHRQLLGRKRIHELFADLDRAAIDPSIPFEMIDGLNYRPVVRDDQNLMAGVADILFPNKKFMESVANLAKNQTSEYFEEHFLPYGVSMKDLLLNKNEQKFSQMLAFDNGNKNYTFIEIEDEESKIKNKDPGQTKPGLSQLHKKMTGKNSWFKFLRGEGITHRFLKEPLHSSYQNKSMSLFENKDNSDYLYYYDEDGDTTINLKTNVRNRRTSNASDYDDYDLPLEDIVTDNGTTSEVLVDDQNATTVGIEVPNEYDHHDTAKEKDWSAIPAPTINTVLDDILDRRQIVSARMPKQDSFGNPIHKLASVGSDNKYQTIDNIDDDETKDQLLNMVTNLQIRLQGYSMDKKFETGSTTTDLDWIFSKDVTDFLLENLGILIPNKKTIYKTPMAKMD